MSDTTPPNLRIMKIFEVIAAAGRPLTATEINESLGWPKQSLHRLCQTLIAEGYLTKQARRLHPSQRLLNLTSGLAQQALGHTARQQIFINIAHESGETVNFARPEIKGMIYADRVETNWPFRVLLPVGTHVPFHCTASGKTYLASLPAAKRRMMLASLDLSAYTAATHTSIQTLEAELKQVSKIGYALDLEEFHNGMIAIAVPVVDDKGRYIAAIAIHGPKQRFDESAAMQHLDTLLQASKSLLTTFDY